MELMGTVKRWLPHLWVGTSLLVSLLACRDGPASLVGTVTDLNGDALPRVRVTLLARVTSDPAMRFTDRRGEYEFEGLRPGSYTVRFETGGHRTHELEITAHQGRRLNQDAQLESAPAHEPIPLYDVDGNVITADSTEPFSGRQTCGPCHDIDTITNGYHFQQGRTDSDGHVIVKDDFFDDGRFWMRSPGRMGVWSHTARQFAAKHNENESQIDRTTSDWIRSCGGCHPGGGQGEFDLDGQLLYDRTLNRFGYETLGKTREEAYLDGDYWEIDASTGTATHAPWDVVGLLEPDCLLCHRARTGTVPPDWADHDADLFSFDAIRTRRAAVMSAYSALRDGQGRSLPAFATAATAGQGWFSKLDVEGSGPPTLQIDYSVGLADGSLILDEDGNVNLAPGAHDAQPTDRVCWGCHLQGKLAYGMSWFDTRDVHYRHLNHLNDEDPENDIPPAKSRTCSFCHPGSLDHDFAKGNSPQMQHRNDLDYVGFRSCRDCHLKGSLLRDDLAPEVPGEVLVHNTGRMLEVLSCQACHIPYTLHWAFYFVDGTAGQSHVGTSLQYLSADPLEPANSDKTRWYPPFLFKNDSDGERRIFPWTPSLSFYWADWDWKGTPDDLSDDVIAPVVPWRVPQAIGAPHLPLVTDDNGDGVVEVNRRDEIRATIEALKGQDRYGRQVAARPVLVKGTRVWYEDPEQPQGVGFFEREGLDTPIPWVIFSWGLDHNVLPKEEAWGYDDGDLRDGCRDCHRPDKKDSPVMDRLVLIDPYGPDGEPVYTTVRKMTGLDPPGLPQR